MTHNLLLNYGLYRKMEIYRPHKATQEEMTKFHSDDYIRFLRYCQNLLGVFWFPVFFQANKLKILFPFRSIRPDNMGEYNKQMQRFNVGEDCPVFDGLYEFCQVWPITQFFLFPFCENSLICLEGKLMTPHRGNTFLFRSSQQLPRLRLGPSKGFLS